ncbi:cytoskeletal protein binding protein, partial [Ascosphaera acerosa]
MGFVGVYVAVYDYEPRADNELELKEGDLLYILEKSSVDDWWKAKRKAASDEEEESEGLVPNNYVAEAQPIAHAKALYDYTRQTDEEVSFPQDADLAVFDTSDPDWTLVRVAHDYGFAPANYIEVAGAESQVPPHTTAAEVAGAANGSAAQAPQSPYDPSSYHAAAGREQPAAALAGILHGQRPSLSRLNCGEASDSQADDQAYARDIQTEEDREDEAPPALPQRPMSTQVDRMPRHDRDREQRDARDHERDYQGGRYDRAHSTADLGAPGVRTSMPYGKEGSRPSHTFPSGYHLYNISESVTVMGKKKKLPTTLGININEGMILISRSKDDDRMEQWSVDKLTNYSIEGKHVFLDLVRPSKSIDFHAGAKDTAQEIVSLLGEIAGRYRAEGLKEVIAAGRGGGKKHGTVLYDFEAQGDDEVTVHVGDEVLIVDDVKSEEWWMVRHLGNGREGVVPSSYIEIIGTGSVNVNGNSNAELSLAERSRLEEERLAREALRKSSQSPRHGPSSPRVAEVGTGPIIPRRRSSLTLLALSNEMTLQRPSESRSETKHHKAKPDPDKLRRWTDRTGTFNVIAQFKGLTDGKIHLHKENGVQIAVPVVKMSLADIEYVEGITGVSLDDEKPLSAVKAARTASQQRSSAGAAVQQAPTYDWFDFFLKAGVPPQFCERYAQNFVRDSMDESILPDITTENLRTLGLKEGDILRVMKYLDNLLGRNAPKSKPRSTSSSDDVDGGDAQGGLFSGPGGTLHNNTRKGRPSPAVQTSDVVDPKVFEPKEDAKSPK